MANRPLTKILLNFESDAQRDALKALLRPLAQAAIEGGADEVAEAVQYLVGDGGQEFERRTKGLLTVFDLDVPAPLSAPTVTPLPASPIAALPVPEASPIQPATLPAPEVARPATPVEVSPCAGTGATADGQSCPLCVGKPYDHPICGPARRANPSLTPPAPASPSTPATPTEQPAPAATPTEQPAPAATPTEQPSAPAATPTEQPNPAGG